MNIQMCVPAWLQIALTLLILFGRTQPDFLDCLPCVKTKIKEEWIKLTIFMYTVLEVQKKRSAWTLSNIPQKLPQKWLDCNKYWKYVPAGTMSMTVHPH